MDLEDINLLLEDMDAKPAAKEPADENPEQKMITSFPETCLFADNCTTTNNLVTEVIMTVKMSSDYFVLRQGPILGGKELANS